MLVIQLSIPLLAALYCFATPVSSLYFIMFGMIMKFGMKWSSVWLCCLISTLVEANGVWLAAP